MPDVVPTIGVDLERPGGGPSLLEGSPLCQPTPRHPTGRPIQQMQWNWFNAVWACRRNTKTRYAENSVFRLTHTILNRLPNPGRRGRSVEGGHPQGRQGIQDRIADGG